MRLILCLFLLIAAVNCARKLEYSDKPQFEYLRVCFKGTLLKGGNEYIYPEVLVDKDDKKEVCAVKWHVSKTNELIKVESTPLVSNQLEEWNKRKCGWVGEENDNFIFVTTSNLIGSNSRMWTKAARFPECFDIDGDSDVGPSGWKEALGAIMYDGYETLTKVEGKLKYDDGRLLKHLSAEAQWDPFDVALNATKQGLCLRGILYDSSKTEKKPANVVTYNYFDVDCFITWRIPVKNGGINGRVIAETRLHHEQQGKSQHCNGFFVYEMYGNYKVTTVIKNGDPMNWKLAATQQQCFITEKKDDDRKIQKLWLKAIAAAKDTEFDLEDYNWVMQLHRVQTGIETLKARKRPIVTTTEPSVGCKPGSSKPFSES